MKRVLVIGSAGAGKSTFSRRLAEITRLPLVHLDQLFWKPGWVEPDRTEWAETVRKALRGESWIIDGNYSGTMEMRLAECDTAIFLDLPRVVCTLRVLKRAATYRRRNRPDIPEGCDEKLDLKFLRFVWTYPTRSRPNVLDRLERVMSGKRIITLRTRREVAEFLENCASRYAAEDRDGN